MDTATLLGLAAGFLTTAGVALWLVYGILQEEPPMILWNAVSLVLGLGILGMKIKYG